MKYSLLDLVQNILSSMDSDEINSINDTPESQQVVKIVKTVYDDITTRSGVKTIKGLFNLTSSGDATKPVLMTLPSTIRDVDWIRYDCRDINDTDSVWRDINYMEPDVFINHVQNYTPSNSDIDIFSYTSNGFSFNFPYQNNAAPQYYTSFNDTDIIFDAYDSGVENTLQSSKNYGYGTRHLAFIETDTFVPELQADQFSLLLNEAKSLAWAELKQIPHAKAEVTARKNWSHLAKTRRQVPTGKFYSGAHTKDLVPNYGRK